MDQPLLDRIIDHAIAIRDARTNLHTRYRHLAEIQASITNWEARERDESKALAKAIEELGTAP
jgi:hypothetical protein